VSDVNLSSILMTKEDDEWEMNETYRESSPAGFVHERSLESLRKARFSSSADTKLLDGLDSPRVTLQYDTIGLVSIAATLGVYCQSSSFRVHGLLPTIASLKPPSCLEYTLMEIQSSFFGPP
jgi:hypothetical protein